MSDEAKNVTIQVKGTGLSSEPSNILVIENQVGEVRRNSNALVSKSGSGQIV